MGQLPKFICCSQTLTLSPLYVFCWARVRLHSQPASQRVVTKEANERWIEFPPQTSRGSFSAVSTPMFARKYTLDSSWRDEIYMFLHRSDLNISAEVRPHCLLLWIFTTLNFSNNIVKIVQCLCRFVLKLHQFLSEFHRFFRNFFHNPHTENLKKILGFFHFAY